MNNQELEERILLTEKWMKTARVTNSVAIVAFSAKRLVFFSVNTQKSGRFVDFINLEFVATPYLHDMLEKSLRHVEAIWQKYAKPVQIENREAI